MAPRLARVLHGVVLGVGLSAFTERLANSELAISSSNRGDVVEINTYAVLTIATSDFNATAALTPQGQAADPELSAFVPSTRSPPETTRINVEA
jgi:hypothetical protein